jgi:hypothetical protein
MTRKGMTPRMAVPIGCLATEESTNRLRPVWAQRLLEIVALIIGLIFAGE